MGNSDKSEWLWISLIDLSKRANPRSVAREHSLKFNLSNLYLHYNLEQCLHYSDWEIQTILDLKKKYDQDEDYFSWLDQVP